MPRLDAIQDRMESYLSRGISAAEAEEIVSFIGKGSSSSRQKETVSQLYKSFFTRAGAERWKELTGITVRPAGAKNGADSIELSEDARIYASAIDLLYDVKRTAASVSVRRTVANVYPTDHELAVSAELSEDDPLLGRGLPPKVLLWGLTGGSGLVEDLVATLRQIEADVGDNNGRLAPRDLRDAPEELEQVMNGVYRHLGRRLLSIDDIAAELPRAIVSLIGKKRSELQRRLFRSAAEETLERLQDEYRVEVFGSGVDPVVFFRERGFSGPPATELRARLPRPTLDELASLYARALRGEIDSHDFYAVAGIGRAELIALHKAYPDRFPNDDPYKPMTLERREVVSAENDEMLARAWEHEVRESGGSIWDFTSKYGLDHFDMVRLRREHPGCFVPFSADDAREMGRVLTELALAHPAEEKAEIIARFQADRASVKRFGTLTMRKWDNWRNKLPDAYPDMKRGRRLRAAMAEAVREIRDQNPTLSFREVNALLARRYPRSNDTTRRNLLAKLMPKTEKPAPFTEADYRDLAERAAALLEKHPDWRVARVAEKTVRIDPRYKTHQIYRAAKRFPDLFVGTVLEQKARPDRLSHQNLEQLELARLLAPPGTSKQQLYRDFRAYLAARGVDASEHASYVLRGHSEFTAARAAEVVAEYARAAKRGARQREIFAAVYRDYPTLEGRLTRCLERWKKHPNRYPALRPFFEGSQLHIRGLNQRIETSRFLGGWDPERAVLQGDHPAAERAARLSQSLLLADRLPMVDWVAEELAGGRRPFAQRNVLWVSHLLADGPAFARNLRQLGVAGAVVVGTPYGSSPTAVEAIEAEGFDVRVPGLSVEDYEAKVAAALDEMVKEARQSPFSTLVLDDGGLVAKLLHENPDYADVRDRFRIVEQTTGGIILAERANLETPVINVAKSRCKKAEGKYIGRIVAERVTQVLERFGGSIEGKETVVVGYGTVGKALARELTLRGARVTVAERSRRRARAAAKEYSVVPLEEAAPTADILIGTTGTTSIDLGTLELLKDGAFVASASSKQVEIAMQELASASSSHTEIDPHNPILTLPNVRYELGGRSITVLGDGWPVNFDGNVCVTPPEQIQLTMAAMLAGLLQAASMGPGHRGLIDLDEDADRAILEEHLSRSAETSEPEISNADDWRDHIRGFLGEYRPYLEAGSGTGRGSHQVADIVAARARELQARYPFIGRTGICEAINADAELVAELGEIDEARYSSLAQNTLCDFPDLDDIELRREAIREFAEVAIANDPLLTRKELLDRAKEHFSFASGATLRTRLYEMKLGRSLEPMAREQLDEFVEDRLDRGLKRSEVEEIFSFIRGHHERTRNLVAVSEQYGAAFTDAAKRRWLALTGIDLGTEPASYDDSVDAEILAQERERGRAFRMGDLVRTVYRQTGEISLTMLVERLNEVPGIEQLCDEPVTAERLRALFDLAPHRFPPWPERSHQEDVAALFGRRLREFYDQHPFKELDDFFAAMNQDAELADHGPWNLSRYRSLRRAFPEPFEGLDKAFRTENRETAFREAARAVIAEHGPMTVPDLVEHLAPRFDTTRKTIETYAYNLDIDGVERRKRQAPRSASEKREVAKLFAKKFGEMAEQYPYAGLEDLLELLNEDRELTDLTGPLSTRKFYRARELCSFPDLNDRPSRARAEREFIEEFLPQRDLGGLEILAAFHERFRFAETPPAPVRALALARKATEVHRRYPFATRDELIDRINQDREWTDVAGALTGDLYHRLRAEHRAEFPDLTDKAMRESVVNEAAAELRKKNDRDELVAALLKRFPYASVGQLDGLV